MAKGGGTRRGNGSGWGGPAKGAGSKTPAHPPFEPGNTLAVGQGNAGQAGREAAKTARELVISKAVAAAQVWIDVMEDKSQPGAVRVAAAAKVVEHAEGTPIARSVNVHTDATDALSDAELEAAIAALRKDIAADKARADRDAQEIAAETAGLPALH